MIDVLLILVVSREYCLAYENTLGPDYGNLWLLFVDENNATHELHFSNLPEETRGLYIGKVYCYLYTRQNKDKGELLTTSNDSKVKSNYFNASNGIRAITHGWLSSEKTEWIQHIKNKFLATSDLNIITVDWSEISKNPLYPWPAFSTRYVGKHLAKVLNSLTRNYNVTENMHLIGHSLGAHVMGYAGSFSDKPPHRITGLDPARPLFEIPLMSPKWRLEKSDAQFVDIIHTCAGIYGYKMSHGHADFYPNSGKPAQPGCEGLQQRTEACSHGRAHEYFLESIHSNKGFYSYPCESWDNFESGRCTQNRTLMGYPAIREYGGDFYLHTTNQSEYAKGE